MRHIHNVLVCAGLSKLSEQIPHNMCHTKDFLNPWSYTLWQLTTVEELVFSPRTLLDQAEKTCRLNLIFCSLYSLTTGVDNTFNQNAVSPTAVSSSHSIFSTNIDAANIEMGQEIGLEHSVAHNCCRFILKTIKLWIFNYKSLNLKSKAVSLNNHDIMPYPPKFLKNWLLPSMISAREISWFW